MIYTGIGSRETPKNILEKMVIIAKWYAENGHTLRSGGAEGADNAFEKGCDVGSGRKEIYLPWKGFNRNPSPLFIIPSEAFEIAAKFHPAWSRCSNGARMLHARNVMQVLGKDPKNPVLSDLVVCWHQGHGGTTQACRIAAGYGVKVKNLALEPDWLPKG